MRAFTGSWTDWNNVISHLPGAHLLQTAEWAKVKQAYGWNPLPFIWLDRENERSEKEGQIIAAAMLLKKSISLRGFSSKLSILYCPKGPMLDWNNQSLARRVMNELEEFARKQSGIFLKIDPDIVLGYGIPGQAESTQEVTGSSIEQELKQNGWLFSQGQIQYRNTVTVDLLPNEEDILARMKQKTRYNIRLASKKGVTVRQGNPNDFPMLYQMYAETSVRDGFVIRDQDYYSTVWKTFMDSEPSAHSPSAIPLIAEVNGDPAAGLFLFYFSGRAYYLYGMSRDVHREKMPNHLLQWQAILQAKTAGCRIYDLWGAPDEFDESDSMWGVYKFKEGLGGKVVRTIGAWDYAPQALWYKLYTEIIPRTLSIMRRRGKQLTRQQLDS